MVPCFIVGSTAARLTRVSASVEQAGNQEPCFIVGFGELVDFTALSEVGLGQSESSNLAKSGSPSPTSHIYGIDEIHIDAVDPTVLATLFEKLKVTTSGMETFTIVNGQTSLPAMTANAGEDKEICAGSAVTLGGNPTGSGACHAAAYVCLVAGNGVGRCELHRNCIGKRNGDGRR